MLLKQIHVPEDKEERRRNFNTANHKDPQYPPKPRTAPLHLTRWLPLIFKDRPQDYVVLKLNPVHIRLLKDFTNAGIQYQRLNESSYEDLIELDVVDIITAAIQRLGGRVFARWDEMSPKDGIFGTRPMTSAREVLNQICTAARTLVAIEDMEKFCEDDGCELRCPLILMKYDFSMNMNHEFRCFVHWGRLTGISQYKWHEYSSDWSNSATSIWALADNMCTKILKFNQSIMFANREDKYAALLHAGFTFDVLVKGKNVTEEVEAVQLIELNSFGPNSLCGSALFHWTNDWAILTGASLPELRTLAAPKQGHSPLVAMPNQATNEALSVARALTTKKDHSDEL